MDKIDEHIKILDVCCGSKMFWYDKENKDTIFMDIRKEILEFKDRDKLRKSFVNPDIIADFRDIPFDDNYFDLVVFDPPHLSKIGDKSWLAKKYGKLNKDTWPDDLEKGFSECMRVLKDSGVLIFKWNDYEIHINEVFNKIKYRPILGDKRGKTRWLVFIKEKEID